MNTHIQGVGPRSRPVGRIVRIVAAATAVALVLVGCGADDAQDPPVDPVDAPASEPAPDEDATPPAGEPEGAPDAPAAPSGAAPRADLPMFPGAELVHEQVLEAAVEEVWVVDAPLDDVLEFYAAMSGLERLPDSAMTSDDGGGYLELDLFGLVRAGETDRAVYEAAVAEAEYGALMRIAVVTDESQILTWFGGGAAAQDAIPPGRTVIVLGVLTG